ncbi:GNAT family N-acetyltransferase [Saccharothrix obliqua]|uniref:GNAT family N-acetyltransferase n=1 Tax=Saccharothrix obliqua TaxID=2861747 RepID=UPI001C5EBCC6|nr:GNAT family N-acetyltransferase [Saccharothrix obliqua]MBW4717827.1 GNAT family N-acetyltransferase [Saccharothrix obliqua]
MSFTTTGAHPPNAAETAVTIRRAVPSDAERLTALAVGLAAYQGKYARILRGWEVTGEYVENNLVYLAESGDLLGYYALITPPELDLLFVADSAQGRGVGRLLVAHMLSTARAHGMTRVRVVSHPDAEGFYRAMGAHWLGTVRPDHRVGWPRPEFEFRPGPA